ncbi:hypothetical protein GWK18_07235 [Kocuria sp. JC486]|uniref:hypothetical protein n=1 Tax=Kocuria sp. JC486 TaxID=1970736 RepID=UPI0014225A9E|nr:hypothetical protein [Kocuria sp. JC486]NHU85385.1 hypothetical protein [Kocuria sp. JC486]
MRILASNLGIRSRSTQRLDAAAHWHRIPVLESSPRGLLGVAAALLLLSGLWATAGPAQAAAGVVPGRQLPALSVAPEAGLKLRGWIADPWPWQALAEGAGPLGVSTTWCTQVDSTCRVRQHREIL